MPFIMRCSCAPGPAGDLRLPAARSDRRPESPLAADGMKSLEQVLIDLFNGDQPNFYQRIDEAVLRVAYVYCERISSGPPVS